MPRFRRLFRFPSRTTRQIEREVDEELRFHLDMRAAELVERGLVPSAAREEALRQFGDLEATRAYCREQDLQTEKATGRSTLLEEVRQDLRFGTRLLRRSPGFTLSTVLTLALAIGVNTTVFSLVRALIFPSVPVTEPHRLVHLWAMNPTRSVYISPLSEGDVLDLRQGTRSLEDVAAYALERPHLTGGTQPDRIVALRGTTNLLPLLGVRPALGRGFRPGDGRPGRSDLVLLSHRAWELRLHADPTVVGRTIRLEGRPHTVIGVLPEGFWFASRDAQVWLPHGDPPLDASREARGLQVIGRLAPSATAAAAQAEMDVLAHRAESAHPTTNEGWGIRVTGLLPLGPGEKIFFALVVGLVALLLAAACAHVANLQLARGVDRHPELAVRSALGAGRRRLVRQLLVESALLASLGAAGSVLVAAPCLGVLRAVFGARTPYLAALHLDGASFLLTLGLAAGATLLSGFVPAIRGSRCDIASVLRGGTSSASRRVTRWHGALVAGEAAVATVLLIVTVLVVRSGQAAMAVGLGFRTERVLTFPLEAPTYKYAEATDAGPLMARVLEAVRDLPGVHAAGAATDRPVQLGRNLAAVGITVEGRPPSPDREPDWAQETAVTTGYFEALGIPLLAGRLFEAEDVASVQEPVVVNRAMAERYWSGGDAVGRRLKRGPADSPGPWLTVLGVVGNVRADDPASPPPPRLYLLEPRHPARALIYFAATEDAPRTHFEDVRTAVRQVDPELPLPPVRSLEQVLDDDYAGAVLGQNALETLGLVAVVLACLGVYSMLAYSVSRRRREMAIRLAVGASERSLLCLVLRQGLRAVLVGVVVGAGVALFVSRGLKVLLFGVTPSDPLTYGVIALLVVSVTMAASILPARRAARADPSVLRHEGVGDGGHRSGPGGGAMPWGLSRARACWMLDHALPIAGALLLAAGQIRGGWLTPLGWTAISLAAVAWLAESSGYSIPRWGRSPILALGCGEVPLAFGVSRGRRHFLFTREVAGPTDPWPDEYAVYEMPAISWLDVASSLGSPPVGARRLEALVSTRDLRFEHHEHSYVDGASLGQALCRVLPPMA
jgi:putative ABC transport system permease protein